MGEILCSSSSTFMLLYTSSYIFIFFTYTWYCYMTVTGWTAVYFFCILNLHKPVFFEIYLHQERAILSERNTKISFLLLILVLHSCCFLYCWYISLDSQFEENNLLGKIYVTHTHFARSSLKFEAAISRLRTVH